MKVLLHLVVMTLAAAMFSTPVQAQAAEDFHPFLTDTFNLRIGALA